MPWPKAGTADPIAAISTPITIHERHRSLRPINHSPPLVASREEALRYRLALSAVCQVDVGNVSGRAGISISHARNTRADRSVAAPPRPRSTGARPKMTPCPCRLLNPDLEAESRAELHHPRTANGVGDLAEVG